MKYARPTHRFPAAINFWYRRVGENFSHVIQQRQHTVSTSAYSTIIEILQLLQTVVTIGL
jgi:hypothetical protein